MNTTSTLAKIGTIATAALLAACGGGGTDGTPASTPGQAQGVYAGSFSSNAFPAGRFSTLILDNDESWTLYGENGSNGELLVYGVIQGAGRSASGSYTSTVKDYFYDGSSITGTLQASYQAGSSFNGVVSANGQFITFSGLVPAPGSTSYDYNAAANLAEISGAWSGTSLSGSSSTFNITPSGTFSGVNLDGCGFSGTVTPRSSGKNVFDVALTNNTSPACGAASGLSGRGIALSALLSNNSRQLIVAVVTNDRAYGSAVFATR